ncbi:MAG: leucyl/phenylalanyl-tRNA--protein transferase [Saprospiraceae bacterium]|nr:leucyl/phenylalanyl-tRNA--protein transferase [Saprospiraceae bacterium]
MPIYALSDELAFPNPSFAEDGLLAVGGDLSQERLVLAYKNGIFPWYNPGDPILWWSPDPRFVLFPKDLKVSKSMRPYFNQKKYNVTFDTVFEQVIDNCAKVKRPGQGDLGTWITEEMRSAYIGLHKSGLAHSAEVWKGETLVGGLYGIAIGKIFFGESMFALAPNASKFGFISLVKRLGELNYELVDCQQETGHLGTLGAKPIDLAEFQDILKRNASEGTHLGNWMDILNTELPKKNI